ncbi:MFS transporter [Saccharothrix sp. AJ9571]|nr:MFS transporter [Saccharothrix sp. AJ9571]
MIGSPPADREDKPKYPLRSLVRREGWLWWASGAVLSRLPGNMVPITLILAFAQGRGALVAGCFTFGTVTAAVWRAKALDRTGARRGLGKEALLSATAQAILVLVVVLPLPTAGLTVIAALAGAAGSAVSAGYRAALPQIVPAPLLPAAYTADAVIIEVSFVVSPVLAAGVITLFSPAVVFLLGVVFALTAAVAARRLPAGRKSATAAGRVGRLSPALPVFVVAAGSGTVLGLLQAGVPAKLLQIGWAAAAAGLLFSVMSATSGIVGAVITARGGLHGHSRRTATVLFALATIAVVLLAVGPDFPTLLLAMALFGAPLAPLNALAGLVIVRRVPEAAHTQAFAVLSMCTVTGSSIGLAAAGVLVPAGYAGPSLAAAALCAVITTTVAVAHVRHHRHRPHLRRPA